MKNTSDCYTFEYKGSTDKNKVKYNAIKSSKAPEIVRYDGKDKFSDKLTVTPEKFEHHYEKGNLFSYKNNGEFFKIELVKIYQHFQRQQLQLVKKAVQNYSLPIRLLL